MFSFLMKNIALFYLKINMLYVFQQPLNIFYLVETAFRDKEIVDCQQAVEQFHYLRELVDDFNENQIERIRDDSSKTRLSILFYAIGGNCVMMAKQNVKLLDIFNESFKLNQKCS